MTKYPFKENIKKFITVLKEDLFLKDVENTFKVADRVEFAGKPSVIAASIIYKEYPETYDLLMFTGNITGESIFNTVEKLNRL